MLTGCGPFQRGSCPLNQDDNYVRCIESLYPIGSNYRDIEEYLIRDGLQKRVYPKRDSRNYMIISFSHPGNLLRRITVNKYIFTILIDSNDKIVGIYSPSGFYIGAAFYPEHN